MYRDEMKRLEGSRREHAILSSSKATSSQLSNIQLCFLVQRGLVSASELAMSCLRFLPELLIVLDKGANEVCARLMQSRSMGKKSWHNMRELREVMLRRRNEIWNCLHETSIDVESLRIDVQPALLVSTARLHTVLEQFLKASEFLETKTIQEIRHTFDRFSQALLRDCVENSSEEMNELKESSLFGMLSGENLPIPASNRRNYDVMRSLRRASDMITTSSSSSSNQEEESKEDQSQQLGLFVSPEDRNRLVGVLSTLRCAQDSEEMIHTAESLTENILKRAAKMMESKKKSPAMQTCFEISEVSLLSSSRKEMIMLVDALDENTKERFFQRCKNLIEWGSGSQTRRSIRDVIEWQHLLWLKENGTDDRVPIFEIASAWHCANWNVSKLGCLGDSEYTKALTSLLYGVTYEKLPVEKYRSSVNVLVALQSEIMKSSTSEMSNAKSQDGKLLWYFIRESILCLSECKDWDLSRTLEQSTYILSSAFFNLSEFAHSLTHSLIHSLTHSYPNTGTFRELGQRISTRVKNARLREKMLTLLLPSVRLLLEEDLKSRDWKRRGEAWTRFGLFQMFVTVPNLPIDPQVPDMLKKWHVDRSLRRAQAIEEIERLKLVRGVRVWSSRISLLFHVSICHSNDKNIQSYRSFIPQEIHSKINARIQTRL